MPEEVKKKKLIRVKMLDALHTGYTHGVCETTLSFALVGPNEELIKDKDLRRKIQMSRFVECREQLCCSVRNFIHNIKGDSFIDLDESSIDLNSFRLLIGLRGTVNKEDAKEKIFSGKRALNLLEQEAGWDTSVITTVKHEDYKKDNIWMLTGPEKWMRAPQLISLACLILRVAYKYGPLKTDSIDELRKHFNLLVKENKGKNYINDIIFIGNVRKNITPLMQRVDEVFGTDKLKSYTPRDGKGWNGYGGIDSLVKCATGDDELHKRFKKYVLDVKKEKKKTWIENLKEKHLTKKSE